MTAKNRWGIVCLCFLAILLLLPALSAALPEYASRTAQSCQTCHINPSGGGALSERGLEYAASGYVWPPRGGFRVIGPIKKYARLAIGFLHITAAFLWLGTILYVHLLLRPAYASRGLPKGEVALGLFSMGAVGVTGLLLTLSRIKSVDVLFNTPWGIVLSIKILIFIVMVSTALFTVFLVGPKLKKGPEKAMLPEGGVFDPLSLSRFDGKEGRPAYIAFEGKVYDVTGLNLWGDGVHMKRHTSGSDLTPSLAKAPHGCEKIEALEVVGTYDASLKPRKTSPQKAFYFIAYMNLLLVFTVLFVVAYWRWGL